MRVLTNLSGKSVADTILSHFFQINVKCRTTLQVSLEHGHFLEKEKKRALQRKFEEPCASEGLLSLPLSCM